ncbi:organic cation transporter protein-like [Pocillopora damicornis]|uniref:organic cation transporter protein-like n=1 Tax=Pocillopora damicornis TaxID=46731 RepID=UPI000F55956E|nr:organic cation transporter protein-like [Pocillopora damicornis]
MEMDEVENPEESTENRSTKEIKIHEFDDLLKITGGFGRYQMVLYTFMCLVSIPTGAQLLIQVFYGASPPFVCVSTSRNETCASGCCSSCHEYEFRGPFTSAVSQWNLICDRRHLKAMTQAVFMAGLFVGAITFGSISDHFGRKFSFFLSVGVLATFASASAVADCLSLFSLFRFFAGAGTVGCLLVRFVYCVEMVVTAHRSYIGMINFLFLTVGGCFLALLAYLIPNWRYLMLAVSLPSFLPIIAWWWIPRSPRWLIANNHLDEAHEVLMKYAKYNHVTVDSKHLKHLIQEVRKTDARKFEDEKYGILDTVKTPKLRKRTLIMFFNWCANALVFYGLNYNIRNLAGNMYLNFFLLLVVDFPSTALCCYCLQRYENAFLNLRSRRFVTFRSDDLSSIVFFLYRNNGVGLCSMIARIGGIAASYVVLLADLPNLRKTFPLLIFGALSVAAGVMAFWLPETVTSEMPQTVEQAEAWEEDYKIYCCRKPRIQSPRGEVVKDEEDTALV